MQALDAPANEAAIREFVEEVVEDAEDGLHDASMALRASVRQVEHQIALLRQGTILGRHAIDHAEESIATGLRFAHKVLHATSIEDAISIQLDHLRSQAELAAEHFNDLTDTARRLLKASIHQ